jgi:hypothetical protein
MSSLASPRRHKHLFALASHRAPERLLLCARRPVHRRLRSTHKALCARAARQLPSEPHKTATA